MKISIISDFHFGFGSGTERENDPFESAEEAFEKALDSDIILIAGDIFDTRSPGTETLTKAMELFIKPLITSSETRLVKGINKNIEKVLPMGLSGIPMVAIHGTHERRVKGFLNPVEALERAGFIIYLHCNGAVFQKGEEKVCIQGMSGVPDQYSETVLKNWNPRPFPGCFNIFMLHQSVSPFLKVAPHTIDINKLPGGFNLYICGHIHKPEHSVYSNAPFLIPGSLVPTQLTKEATQPVGFWQIETNPLKIDFIELENQRRFYYEELENPTTENIENKIKTILEKQHKKKPLIRINISGKTAAPLNEIKTKFENKAMIFFKKEPDKKEHSEKTKTLEEHKLSVQELGKKLLEKNLKELKLDPGTFENIFELLLEKKHDEALEFLKKNMEKEQKESSKKHREETEGKEPGRFLGN